MTHFMEQCKHGIVYAQCRCPSPEKTVRRVPCGGQCARHSSVAGEDQPDLQACDRCGAICDPRVQVCQCGPDCSYPPVSRMIDEPIGYRATQRALDNEPCSICGGDRLRQDFTGSGRCHVSDRSLPEVPS